MTPPKETHAFAAETAKVLKLMIHSLYTNRDIFLRELISNSSDACDKLRYEAISKPELLNKDPDLKIRLSSDKKAQTVTIEDNGIGMSRDELIANLGTIAKSGTQEFIHAMSNGKKDVSLIGQFGVGFYSAFMVADRVQVVSRKAGEEKAHAWESDGGGEFTVAETESDIAHGTRIILHIKKEDETYLDRFKLEHIAKTYSDHISFPIEYLDEEGKTHVLTSGKALWTLSKSEITPEQYKEFYHHVAHSPDEPWMILHNKAEGKIEYTNLLFIPSIRPFDLFHPDRKRRVKLYVRRVYITDENANIIPHYLRFLRGIVDSEDLPLNISRETLQNNPILDKIRDGVVNRILGELKKRGEKDAADYAKFWENFGAVLKEGLCEPIAPRDKLLEVCRFASSTGDALTSLDDYIARMKPGQEEIYYLTGDKLESVRHSPQLEGFIKRGVEVLLFTDPVDDFWVNVVHKYKDKAFKSITRAGIDLDTLGKEETPSTEKQVTKDEVTGLTVFLKSIYGDAVKEVRVTKKLADSPVCLAVGEGDMDIRLEKFLRDNKQLPQTVHAKILEINPSHPIIVKLAEKVAAGAKEAEISDIAWVLLDQARLIEGEEISDPAAFTRRVSELLVKSLAA